MDLPHSADMPPESNEEDEKDEEGLRARLRQVPKPSPSTVPVVPEMKSDSAETPKVLENDLISTALPVDDQDCIFGLNKKIQAAKAQIAALKRAQPLPVSPTPPVTVAEGNKTPDSTRVEEIKHRMEELKRSIESSSKFLASRS